MIKVNPRAHRNEDRAGDPLDGLVNLFDVGIVLAVAFLLAGLASLGLTSTVTKSGLAKPTATPSDAITVSPGEVARTAAPSAAPTAGRGTPVGRVYRLDDGTLIYVVPSGSSSRDGGPEPEPDPMSYFSDGLVQAFDLITSGDDYLYGVIGVTFELAAVSTVVAAVIGLPLGLALGFGKFRGRGIALALANAGVGLPPVLVGLALILLFLPKSPLGALHLAFTLEGVYVAQTLLAFPLIVALTASAVRAITPGLLDQARTLGAGRLQLAVLCVREARIGIVTALIFAIFSAMSEVGAVVLVGGNIEYSTQTLASAALANANAGDFARGLAIGIVLLVLIVVVGSVLTVLQRLDGRADRLPRRAS